MAITYAEALRNARLDLTRDAIDAGAGQGIIEIYDGTRPATGAAITTETLLVSGTFSDPSAANASGGVLTFNALTYATAVATGTATWARIADSTGAFVADADVGATGSGADITLNSTGIVIDGLVNHVSAAITAGN